MMSTAFQVAVVSTLRELKIDVSYTVAVRVIAVAVGAYAGLLAFITVAVGTIVSPPGLVSVSGRPLGAVALLGCVLALGGGVAALVGTARRRMVAVHDPDRYRLHAARSALGCDALNVVTVDRLVPSALIAAAPFALLVGAALRADAQARLALLGAGAAGLALLLTSWHAAVRDVLTNESRPVARARTRVVSVVVVTTGGAVAGKIVREWDTTDIAVDVPHVPLAAVALAAVVLAAVTAVRFVRAAARARGTAQALPLQPWRHVEVTRPLRPGRPGWSLVRLVLGRAVTHGIDSSRHLFAIAGLVLAAGFSAPSTTDQWAAPVAIAVTLSATLASAPLEPDMLWSGRAVRAAYERGGSALRTFTVLAVASAAWAVPQTIALTTIAGALGLVTPLEGAAVGVGAVAAHLVSRAAAGSTWAAPTDFTVMAASTVAVTLAVAVAFLATSSPLWSAAATCSLLAVGGMVWTRKTRYR